MPDAGEHFLGVGSGSAFEGMRLALLDGGNVRAAIQLTGRRVVIGRGDECGLILSDPRASKQHAQVAVHGRGLAVEDMHSTNGTRVNERGIHLQLLKPGDVIRIGQTLLLYLTPQMPLPKSGRTEAHITFYEDGKKPVRLLLGELPLLIGSAPEATLRLAEDASPDFLAQIVAVPGGAQVTELMAQPPACHLIGPETGIEIAPLRIEYSPAPAGPSDKTRPMKPPAGVRRTSNAPEDLGNLLADEANLEEKSAANRPRAASAASDAAALHRIGGCTLTATSGPCAGRSFVLTHVPLMIGTDASCDIRLTDDTNVAPRQARVLRVEGEPVVEDLAGGKGVMVNGEQVRRHPLRPGNVIRVGDSELLVHL